MKEEQVDLGCPWRRAQKGERDEGAVNSPHVSLLWSLSLAKREALDLVPLPVPLQSSPALHGPSEASRLPDPWHARLRSWP